MAAVTSAVIAVGSAGYSIYNSEKKKSDAKKQIEAFERQEFNNPFENLKISTLKADQETDANLSRNATSVDALQRGGTRAVLGGIPKVNESNVLLQNLISQDIEKQDRENKLLLAKGEQNITDLRERREESALLGLGQQLQSARQDSANGVASLVSGGLSFANAFSNNPQVDLTPQVSKVSTPALGISTQEVKIEAPEFDFSDFNF